MNFTEAQLNEIETLAGLFFDVTDIVILMGLDPVSDIELFSEIIQFHPSHALYKAYHKGRLTADVELRKATKQAALNGSTPAQTSMIMYYQKSRL